MLQSESKHRNREVVLLVQSSTKTERGTACDEDMNISMIQFFQKLFKKAGWGSEVDEAAHHTVHPAGYIDCTTVLSATLKRSVAGPACCARYPP